jgi:hypothetical protein
MSKAARSRLRIAVPIPSRLVEKPIGVLLFKVLSAAARRT